MIRQLASLALLFLLSIPAHAEWTLDNDTSSLSFVSTKAVDIAEVHRFANLSGRISDRGDAVVTVTLSSVKTGIDIRDERMRDMLFEVNKYPYATAHAEIGKDVLEELQVGESASMSILLSVKLHDEVLPLEADVIVARMSESVLTVSSTSQIIVNAASFDMTGGIEALRQVANLPSIGNAVPVSFFLTFKQ